MSTFTGRFSVIGSQSNLDDGATDWLILKAGISDPAQATFAAAQFLLKTKKLIPGHLINVVGISGKIGTVSIVSMTNASSAEEAVAVSFSINAAGSKPGGAKSSKKGTSKKSKKDGAKRGSKKSSSRKSTSKSKNK
jgi:hypothetical protein